MKQSQISKEMQSHELMDYWSQELPEKVYLYYEDEEISFKTLNQRVNSAAWHFRSLGIQKGERVGIFMVNSPDFLYAWFGLNKIGAVMVPVNTGFLQNETKFILNDAGCRGIICDEKFLENVVMPSVQHSPSVEWVAIREGSAIDGVLSFKDFIAHNKSVETVHWPNEDLAAILYTSGTTGKPKGVMCPFRYYSTIGHTSASYLNLTPDDRLLTILPLFHMNAQTTSAMGSLFFGASLIMLTGFIPATFWQLINRYKATIFNYLGLMFPFLEMMPVTPEEQNNPVRFVAGAQADPKKIPEYEKRWGLSIIELYGMTEVGGTCNPLDAKKIGSCGIPLPGHELQIIGDKGQALPPGEIGQIIVRGPSMTLGYWNNPEETAAIYRNGWVHTGDVGYLDSEGYLFFVGRTKDIIRRSGENIAAVEVENAVMEHPKITEAAAIPVPDPIRDEEVKIYVVLKPGETPETVPPQEIVDWCAQRMAKFKIPRYVEYIHSLPKTTTFKVKKIVLIDEKPDLTVGAWDRFAGKN
jgi:acyl-coenzyme A synthetase/AMP-(fatty) acid ligase